MGSNGNHRLNQLSHAYLHILQLQWTPMGSNGKPVSAQLMSFKICNSNGLQWAPMVITVWISSAMPISSISDSNGLQWAPMVSHSQLSSFHSKPATPIESNGSNGNHRVNQLRHAYIHILKLQWTPMGFNGKPVPAQPRCCLC